MSHANTLIMFSYHYQRGAALITALLIMTILTILGITVMNMTTLEEKMAFNTQDRYLGRYLSESAVLLLANKTYLPQLAPGKPGETFNQISDLTPLVPDVASGSANIMYKAAMPFAKTPMFNPKAGYLKAADPTSGSKNLGVPLFEISATTTTSAGTTVLYQGGYNVLTGVDLND